MKPPLRSASRGSLHSQQPSLCTVALSKSEELICAIQQWLDHPSREILVRSSDSDFCWNLLISEGATSREDDGQADAASLPDSPRHVQRQKHARFQPRRELGSGGFGVVIEALDTLLGRPVALKMIRPSLGDNPSLVQRFAREARAMAALKHHGIVQIYETLEIAHTQVIVTELVAGPSLADFLRDRLELLDIRTSVKLMQKVAEAVGYAHSRGFLHRDLKPSNILLSVVPSDYGTAELQPRLTDFGLAKRFDGDWGSESAEDITRDLKILGTLRYMSPEQASGRLHDVAISSDIFSLGVVLYQMLTGTLPFDAQLDYQVVQQICSVEPVPIRNINADVPRDLEAIVLKCLAKSTKDRYDSAGDLVVDLGRFLDGIPVLASRPSPVKRLVYWARRHPRKAATSTLLFLMPLVMLSLLIRDWVRERHSNSTILAVLKESGDAIFPLVEKLNDGLTILQEDHRIVVEGQMAATKLVVDQQPNNVSALYRLSVLYHYLGNANHRLGRLKEAIQNRADGLACLERLLVLAPHRRDKILFDKFMAYNQRMILYREVGSEAALQHSVNDIRQATKLIEELYRSNPSNMDYHTAYDSIRMEMVNFGLYSATECLKVTDSIIESSEQLWLENPQQPRLAKYAIEGRMWQAMYHSARCDWPEAIRLSSAALDLLDRAYDQPNRDTWYKIFTAKATVIRAIAEFRGQQWAEVIESASRLSKMLGSADVTSDKQLMLNELRLKTVELAWAAAKQLSRPGEISRLALEYNLLQSACGPQALEYPTIRPFLDAFVASGR